MQPPESTRRFVFRTQGVCPPEIHFRLDGDTLEQVRFVGGGCPGNAQLVARLLQGRPLTEVKPLLEGIACRKGTSCPHQLGVAIEAAQNGRLEPVQSFRIADGGHARERIGLVGSLDGDLESLQAVVEHLRDADVEAVICVGNLTGKTANNAALLKSARKADLLILQGNSDWQYAQGCESAGHPPLRQQERDWLLQLPQVLRFRLGEREGMVFFGEFVHQLPGFSDFEPFGLEINMVCGLTRMMTDREVFPALEAMTPQFSADLVVFGQTGRWGHWQVGGKDFVSVGAARQGNRVSWGLLELSDDGVRLHPQTRPIA